MKLRVTSRSAMFVALLLISVIGVILVLQATPEGAGLSDDSIAYIAGARSMVAGNGYREVWLASDQPVTHFPPAFPAVLVFFGTLGIDPLHAARWVNAILFGASAALLGILAWRMTPSLTAGLVLAGLFVLCADLLQVYATAMSEPLFIFLSLLSFWMFDLYFERHHHWLWMIACGTFVGMAYLTRYAGLALIATFAAALLILHTTWRKSLTSIGILLASTLPWILGWSIRNRLVAGNATNRAFAWHPLTSENIEPGLRVFSDFLIPFEPLRRVLFRQPGFIEALIVLILGGVLVWVIITARRYLSNPQQERTGMEAREVLSFTTGLFIFAYLASIVASMLMFDAATKFKLRILAPVLVSLLILLVVFGIWLRNRRPLVAMVLMLLVLGVSGYRQSITFDTWAKSELGYASFQWYDSKAMDFLSALPEDVMIYTNEPGAVYLYTGRGCYVLPDRFDSSTAIARTNFEKGVALMQADIHQGKAVLALFDGGENVSRDVPALIEGLYLAHKSTGDEIYTARP